MTYKLNTLAIAILVLYSGWSYGQSFNEAELDLLAGKKVRPIIVDESKQDYFYKNFYTDFDTIERTLNKKGDQIHPYQNGTGFLAVSAYNELVGREFTVNHVYRAKAKGSFDKNKYYVFELYNPLLGTYYYEYSTSTNYQMELELADELEFSSEHYCKNIRVENNYEDTIKYYSPEVNNLTLLKFVSSEDTMYYMVFQDEIDEPEVEDTKLIMLLQNGKAYDFTDARLSVIDIGEGYYRYSFSVELPREALVKFRTGMISDLGYSIYSTNYNTKQGRLINAYIDCLLK